MGLNNRVRRTKGNNPVELTLLLFIDADEELTISDPALHHHLEPGVSYHLAKQHGETQFLVPALVNIRDQQWRWCAPAHVYLERASGPERQQNRPYLALNLQELAR